MGKIENTDDIIKAVANSKYYRLSRDEMWEKNIELDVEIESLRKRVKELKEAWGWFSFECEHSGVIVDIHADTKTSASYRKLKSLLGGD